MDLKIYFLLGLILTATVLVEHGHSANILVITFFSRKSHKITYMPLVEELGKRGHNITIVSPVKPTKEMKNVKEIFTLDFEKISEQKFHAFDMKEKGIMKSIIPTVWLSMIQETCSRTYDLPQVRSLLDEKFDLVFLQPLFNDCLLGLVYRLNAPFVLFTPTGLLHWNLAKLGGHFPTSFAPNFLTGYSSEMNFYQRFINFGVTTLADIYLSNFYEPEAERIYREKLGNDIPSINEILANASLVLSNSHFSQLGPLPYLPDTVDVAGIHTRPAKPIPKDLEEFISKGNNGFILFSMGSAIKGDMMPEAKRKMFLNVFSRLGQQVIWKWESETMPDLPKNVKLSKWLPQQDLLGHKDIKMFITHCGGGGLEEAIYHAVPLVGLPMLADQPKNANLAQRHGFIVKLNWLELTEEDLFGAIQEILKNPKYGENAKKISTIFKDRPIHPLDHGVYWIEYVLRHKGAPHLRSAGRKLNYWQYHSYDVIGAYLAIIGLISYLLFASVRFVCRKICCRSSKKIEKVSRGKKSN